MIVPLILIAALATPSQAARFPDCLHVSAASAKVQPDLDALRDCQDKARQKMISAAEAKGKPLSNAALDKLDDHQRAEARAFLAKRTIDGGKLGGLDEKELARAPAKEGQSISALQKRLQDAAGDGGRGVTPAMGQDILDTLEKEQGSVSPEMRDLINAVIKDGGKLTPETMKKLQNAARAAKSQGLDLNIDPKIEKPLLEHDFDADKEENKTPPPGVL